MDKAIVISPPNGREPERFWTKFGPKTAQEIAALVDKGKLEIAKLDNEIQQALIDLKPKGRPVAEWNRCKLMEKQRQQGGRRRR